MVALWEHGLANALPPALSKGADFLNDEAENQLAMRQEIETVSQKGTKANNDLIQTARQRSY